MQLRLARGRALAAASAAALEAGGRSSPAGSAIDLPADHYLHRTAPTEWWWHVGTLRCGERIFGFEINAASYEGQGGFGFTQVMLTDVKRSRHYQRTAPFLPPAAFDGSGWAEFDPTKDWFVRLGSPTNSFTAIDVIDPGSGYTAPLSVVISGGGGEGGAAVATLGAGGQIASVLVTNPGTGYASAPTVTITGAGGTGSGATAQAVHSYVTMNAAWGDVAKAMHVKALLVDSTTRAEVNFDLTLSQEGPPFIVWGTGVQPVPGTSGGHLQTNNYYYSLTRLHASGSITVGGERFPVTGVTWMDHEYGAFTNGGEPVKWILQDMQLDNGVNLSNYTVPDAANPLRLNHKSKSHVTVQRADGTTYFVDSTVTPIGRTWTSPVTGATYFMELLVEIPGFDARLTVTSLVDDQEFPVMEGPVYEGVARASGTFEGKSVRGDAWNEQTFQ